MRYFAISAKLVFYASIAVGVIAVIAILSRISRTESFGRTPVLIVGCMAYAVWMTAIIIARRTSSAETEKRADIWVGLVLAASSLCIAALKLPNSGFAVPVAIFSMVPILFLYKPSVTAAINLSIATGTIVLFHINEANNLLQAYAFFFSVFIFYIYVLGRALEEWREQSAIFERSKQTATQLAHANIRLQEAINKAKLVSRSKERIRVAREIHDTVGYTLTAVLMQIHALQELRKKRVDLVGARLKHLEELVRDAIHEVRGEVSALREEIIAVEGWREQWIEVCREFENSTEMRIQYKFENQTELVDDRTGECINRILQESFTNSYHHGKATLVDVAIGRDNGFLLMRISDNGVGVKKVVPGNGLSGIRERLQGLDGSVAWQSVPHKGFDIGIRVPWREVAS